jgi:hypothetical protein
MIIACRGEIFLHETVLKHVRGEVRSSSQGGKWNVLQGTGIQNC